MIWLGLFIVIPALALAAGALYQWIGVRRDRTLFPPPGQLVAIGGARLHIREMGAGSPSVVLEAGLAGSCLGWSIVQPAVARFAKVLSYDRAGLGWSEAIAGPRTPARLVDELRALLHAAGVRPPYILVGHSFGALIIRAFAARHPAEVAGLVLVDPLDPAEWSPLTTERRATLQRGIRLARRGKLLAHTGLVRLSLGLVLEGRSIARRVAAKISAGQGSSVTERLADEIRKLPPEVRPLVAHHWRQPKSFAAMASHLHSFPASINEIPPILNTPTILITGAHSTGSANIDPAAISTQITHLIAPNSGHWIQLDEPAVVIEAIRTLVNQRSGEMVVSR